MKRLLITAAALLVGCDYSLNLGTVVTPAGDETPPPGSCLGACGREALSGNCWCDQHCVLRRDCCLDKVELCGPNPPPEDSCVGRCIDDPLDEADCWCDPLCHAEGVCCPDKVAECGDSPVTCRGICGFGHWEADCGCDDECQAFGDCCTDFTTVCKFHDNGLLGEVCGDELCAPFAMCCDPCACSEPWGFCAIAEQCP